MFVFKQGGHFEAIFCLVFRSSACTLVKMSSALTKSKKDSDGRLPLRLYYDRGFLFEAPKRAETKTCCSCVQKGTLTKRDKKEIGEMV